MYPRALVLKGPNMGGKSTLLRAVCLAAVLAHVGSWVPAQACTMSVMDAIFCRMGAYDQLLSGRSTFAVECLEAAEIMRGATASSLVVLDELGRGTSSYDGEALADATLQYLRRRTRCLLLFATHYHALGVECGPGEVGVLNTQGSKRANGDPSDATACKRQRLASATGATESGIANGGVWSKFADGGDDQAPLLVTAHMAALVSDRVS